MPDTPDIPAIGLNPTALSWTPPGSTNNANANNAHGNRANVNANAQEAHAARGRNRNRGRGGRGRGGGHVPVPTASARNNAVPPSAVQPLGTSNNVNNDTVNAPSANTSASEAGQSARADRRNVRGRGASRGRGRGRGNGRARTPSNVSADPGANGGPAAPGLAGSSIAPRRSFGRLLTGAAATSAGEDALAAHKTPTGPPSTAPDLMTRIYEDIDSFNYDCVICLVPVTRTCRVWSCTMCFHVTHYACVKTWMAEALTKIERPEMVRCPACNKPAGEAPVREDDNTPKMNGATRTAFFFKQTNCWCGEQKHRTPAPRLLPPNSCGRVCNRKHPHGCEHRCPSACHAGPCPPCGAMGPVVPCYCGGETRSLACGSADALRAWSCGKPCGHTLGCGEHRCEATCHAGDCAPCVLPMQSTCFCGKHERVMACETREPAQVSSHYGTPFVGVFSCGEVCGRRFDCGVHQCAKPCHAQGSAPAHCPSSPDVITHCPCGQTRLADPGTGLPQRTSCEDPVPTCGRTCGKTLDGCGHRCRDKCHTGPCSPCSQIISQPCACFSTTAPLVCSDTVGRETLRCKTPCRSWMSCKQHRCAAVCCPGKPKGVALAVANGHGRTRLRPSALTQADDNQRIAEHVCPRVCGRMLRCGSHACPLPCHKGVCHSCVAYELDDLHCPCGRTVVEAPFLCGTALPVCDADCPRPLACGHPPVPHRCHDDQQTPCPKCPRLVSKSCLCGKLVLGRVACGADNIQCSNICGALLACGVHTCRKACHKPGECEVVETTVAENSCSQTCARAKPVCGHPCANRCHGTDVACTDTDPCGSAVEVHCPCGRLARKVRCNATVADPEPARRHPVCDDECLRIQRNAQLRDALRISDGYKDEHLAYAHDLMEMFLGNRAFVSAHEERIRTFFAAPADNTDNTAAADTTPVCIFKPMKRHERQILHMLAETFGLRSESRDQEPHRHVVLSLANRATALPAFPSLTIAESEEIYTRLRDKAKAEAVEAALAALAVRATKEASDEAAAQRRVAHRRLYNAVHVPAAVKDAIVEHGHGTANTLLASDVFHNIVEAWYRETQSSCPSSSSITLQQHTLPFGDVVLRVVAPATAPAIVQMLTAFLLTYVEAIWDLDAARPADSRLALCHVDAHINVLRMGGSALAKEDDVSPDDEQQWNVVAAASANSSGRSSVDATAWGTVPATSASKPAPQKQSRAVFTIRKKNVQPPVPTGESRKQWMDILASHPTNDEQDDGDE